MRHATFAMAALLSLACTQALLAAGVGLPAGPFTIDPAYDKGVAYTRVLHVATTGNDSTGTGEETRPYASLSRALQSASAGTKVVIHQGTYTGYTWASNLQGTIAAPILITTAPDEGPVIFDRLGTGGEVMHFVDATYLVLENVTIRRATSNGLNIDDGGSYDTPSHHIILRNLTVEDIGTGGNNDGIKLSGVNNIHILGCRIQRIRSGSGIDMVGCHQSVIAYNLFDDLVENGTQTKGGSEDVLILGNLFVRAGSRAMNMGGSTGTQFFRPLGAPFEARNIRAIGNVVKDTQACVAFTSLVDGVVANNTFYMPGKWVARILDEAPSLQWPQNGKFHNNIVYFRKSQMSSPVNIGASTLPETFSFGNNLWYCVDDASFRGFNLSPIPAETGGLYQLDPRFVRLVDAAGTHVNDDFHLLPDSPARWRGLSLAALNPGATGDRDGRRYLAAPTLGAYELGLYGDVDGNAQVNLFDLLAVVNGFGTSRGSAGFNPWADFDRSDRVDLLDLLQVVNHFGESDG